VGPRFGFLLLALLSPGVAFGQEKFEVSILGGASVLDVSGDLGTPICLPCLVPGLPAEAVPFLRFPLSQKQSLGVGFWLGFRLAYDLGPRAQVEAGFGVEPSRTQRHEFSLRCPAGLLCGLVRLPPLQEKVTSYDYDATLLYHFTSSGVRPFVAAGLGGVSFDTPDGVRTNFAFSFAAGVKVNLGRVGARLEAADQLVLDHYLSGRAEHDLRLRGGFSFRP
jgi:hypothetical protein